MNIDHLIQALPHCKSTGTDQWHARCPAHDDHSPSLSIKSLSDGRILIHCHAGCGAEEILEAIGMDMSDLFPPDDHYRSLHRRSAGPSIASLVLSIGSAAIAEGKRLTESEKQEMRTAFIATQRSA